MHSLRKANSRPSPLAQITCSVVGHSGPQAFGLTFFTDVEAGIADATTMNANFLGGLIWV